MAEFVAPQFQNPDLFGSYLRGQQGAVQAAGAQQDLQYRGLQMDQMRQVMAKQGMLLDTAQQIGALGAGQQSTQTGQQPGGATGGIQNGPQGPVSQPLSQDPLTDVMSDRRNALYQKMDLLAGREPFATQKAAEANRLNQLKIQLQGPINLAQRIQTDPQANILVNNNPQLKQMFGQWAAARHMNPADPTVLTVANAQAAARDYQSTLQGQLGEPSNVGFTGTLKPGEAAYQNGAMVAGSPDQVTPYQQQELALRKQEAALANARFKFDQNQSKIPSGYEVNPDDPTGIRPIAGGPKDPSASGAGLGGRDGVMFQRVTSAGNAAAKAITNIGELPISSSGGWLSGRGEPHSILGSVKDVLAQKMTGQDAQTVNVMFSGVGRNLATIETAGLSPGGSLTGSMEGLKVAEGDTQMTKLRKMAEMRQIVEENLGPNLSNPKLAPSQRELVQSIIDKVTKAVPFTQHDITQFEQSKDPKATIMDFAKSSGVQAQADKNADHPAEIQSLLNKYK